MADPTTTGDTLSRLFLGCLLFKLGGEITLTQEEITDIKTMVGGVQILVNAEDSFVLRVKTPEAYIRDQDQITEI